MTNYRKYAESIVSYIGLHASTPLSEITDSVEEMIRKACHLEYLRGFCACKKEEDIRHDYMRDRLSEIKAKLPQPRSEV